MKLAVLSRLRRLYSTRVLAEAARRRGHEVEVIDYLRCHMEIGAVPRIFMGRRELSGFQAVIPRIGVPHTAYGTAVVRQFEMMGVPPANASTAILQCRDKLRCLQLLAQHGLPVPSSASAWEVEAAAHMVQLVRGAPCIIKLAEGTQGVGVIKADTPEAAASVIEAFRGINAHILAQEFIAESAGADVRVVVIGGRAAAAMKRQAKKGEFRANLSRGAKAQAIDLPPAWRRTAERAARALGLAVAGVDILISSRGPLVIEVNASPGLEGIQKATGIDVAGEIIRYTESLVR